MRLGVILLALALVIPAHAYTVKRSSGIGGGSGASTWSDTFNRADETPLYGSGNWSQKSMDGSTDCNLVSNGVVSPVAGNGCIVGWTPDTPTTSANYACTLMKTGTASYAGACTGIDDGAGTGICCTAVGANVAMVKYGGSPPGVTVNTYSGGAINVENGDYVAIVRSGVSSYRCYWCDTSVTGCDDASEWTALGTGVETVTGITDPGQTGLYSSSIAWILDAFGGGNGATLPAPNLCAPNS